MRHNDTVIENKSLDNNLSSSSPPPSGDEDEGVIAIFDVGKTNKKLLLFDEHYVLVHEESTQLAEIADEDGFACEDVTALTQWIKESFDKICNDKQYNIKAVNFSGYGASFVNLDETLQPCLPLCNYLKPYPVALKQQFYNTYGGESLVAKQTASPVLGSLNSGMQLYRVKYEQPEKFKQIKYSLHLPQYLSFILSGKLYSDITSIGCHTNLWHFQKNAYHKWVKKEGVLAKLAPVAACTETAGYINSSVAVGIGLHDSSAALIPYLNSFKEPFVLLSTGTWCISLNPFNYHLLSDYELHHDCLCYLTFEGKPVKASRLFAGYEHEQQVKVLAKHFKKPADYFSQVECNPATIKKLHVDINSYEPAGDDAMVQQSQFSKRDVHAFKTYEEAYHQLIADIIVQQVRATKLVLSGTSVKRIFVDGGFSKNHIYMYLLAQAFAEIEVYAASVAQASALGAALVLHKQWNKQPMPDSIVELKYYSGG